ncbi:MAG: ATP-grasp domain-containing protein [Pelagibacterales bacterium]|nr:ATP-grasp domain-containing protein [Pelagibacterales bacterium]
MKKVIGISGINATDNPGPGCGVARSLIETEKDLNLIGISYDVNDPGNYLPNLFSNSFLMPYPNEGFEVTLNSLQEIKQKSGLDIIIPCLDVELPLMIKNQDYLAKIGIKTLLPTIEQFELRNKEHLTQLSKEIGCLHPKTTTIFNISELAEELRNYDFPVIIKGKYYQAFTCYNVENAILKATEIAASWGFPILLQERVSGQEVNMIALANKEGKVKGRVAIKKQLTTNIGKVWTAVSIKDNRLEKICDSFVEKTKWRGPFELEFISNQEGVYLIEINPRFPAWVYFASAIGINLPKMLLEILENGDCENNFDYPFGKYMVRYSAEFVSDLEPFQNLISYKNRNGL